MSFPQPRSSKGKIFSFILFSWVAVLGVPTLQAQIITTVAGNGVNGFGGNGGPANGALLNFTTMVDATYNPASSAAFRHIINFSRRNQP